MTEKKTYKIQTKRYKQKDTNKKTIDTQIYIYKKKIHIQLQKKDTYTFTKKRYIHLQKKIHNIYIHLQNKEIHRHLQTKRYIHLQKKIQTIQNK